MNTGSDYCAVDPVLKRLLRERNCGETACGTAADNCRSRSTCGHCKAAMACYSALSPEWKIKIKIKKETNELHFEIPSWKCFIKTWCFGLWFVQNTFWWRRRSEAGWLENRSHLKLQTHIPCRTGDSLYLFFFSFLSVCFLLFYPSTSLVELSDDDHSLVQHLYTKSPFPFKYKDHGAFVLYSSLLLSLVPLCPICCPSVLPSLLLWIQSKHCVILTLFLQ